MKVAYIRSLFPTDNDLPKTRLLSWARCQKLGMPAYKTVQEGKLFQSVLTLNGIQYTSSMWYVIITSKIIYVDILYLTWKTVNVLSVSGKRISAGLNKGLHLFVCVCWDK